MGLRGLAVTVWALLLAAPAGAQHSPAPRPPATGRPVRVVMASGRVPSVVDTPLHFKLVRVTLAAGQSSDCGGPSEMVYVVSGGIEGIFDGERRTIREGSAVFLPGGPRSALSAVSGAPATLLHFLLTPAADSAVPPCDRATITDLYQTQKPIEGLKPGPHEFTMTRVSVERGLPRPPMHRRSGAALYYTLAGNWSLHRQDAASEPRARGAIQFEPYDFVHTWENTGDTTGILLQANISPEGSPEIVFLPAQ
jgi:quercetin dioxygenase-like cupin family protein